MTASEGEVVGGLAVVVMFGMTGFAVIGPSLVTTPRTAAVAISVLFSSCMLNLVFYEYPDDELDVRLRL